jgi:hypothetical protein
MLLMAELSGKVSPVSVLSTVGINLTEAKIVSLPCPKAAGGVQLNLY